MLSLAAMEREGTEAGFGLPLVRERCSAPGDFGAGRHVAAQPDSGGGSSFPEARPAVDVSEEIHGLVVDPFTPEERELYIRGLEETALLFRFSVPTIRTWIAKGCPVVQEGGQGRAYELDVRAVSDWLRACGYAAGVMDKRRQENDEQLRLELLGTDALDQPHDGSRRMSPTMKKELLQAEVASVKLAEKRRQLVSADAVLLEWTRSNSMMRDRLRQLPDMLQRQFGLSDEQTTAAMDVIDDTLAEVAGALEVLPEVER